MEEGERGRRGLSGSTRGKKEGGPARGMTKGVGTFLVGKSLQKGTEEHPERNKGGEGKKGGNASTIGN